MLFYILLHCNRRWWIRVHMRNAYRQGAHQHTFTRAYIIHYHSPYPRVTRLAGFVKAKEILLFVIYTATQGNEEK